MRTLIQRFGIGLILTVVLVVAGVVVTEVWGPLFGVWDWTATSAALLVLGAMGLGLAEEFMRQPNRYGRTHHLYDLRDVAPDRPLQSASPTLLWNMLPPVVAAGVLLIV